MMLTGEKLVAHVPDVRLKVSGNRMISGALLITEYRLIFQPKDAPKSDLQYAMATMSIDHNTPPATPPTAEASPISSSEDDQPNFVRTASIAGLTEQSGAPRIAGSPFFKLPLGTIDRADNDGKSALGFLVTVFAKDFRTWCLVHRTGPEAKRTLTTVLRLAFPRSPEALFCFKHRLSDAVVNSKSSWTFDLAGEIDRQGVLRTRPDGSPSPWKLTMANQEWKLSPTYPRLLVVPQSCSPEDLEAISSFRDGQRLPVLTWGNNKDAASIWRCSQPKSGPGISRCKQDERLLATLAGLSKGGKLKIVDCRPMGNALANMALGCGYEGSNYPDCELCFMNIGNIQVMRSSLATLQETTGVGGGSRPDPADEPISVWQAMTEEPDWLGHIRLVLGVSWQVATYVHRERAPVLIHCSHGWDRTSQVSSLAQIMLDAQFRTILGFQSLVEKDWLAFGHPFHARCGHGVARQSGRVMDRMRDRMRESMTMRKAEAETPAAALLKATLTSDDGEQRSPIFLQFLDCVWQLVNQYPSHFEFNTRYLLCIADHLYSCRFGTFVGNSDKDRVMAGVPEQCPSLWAYLDANREAFVNPFYKPAPELAAAFAPALPVAKPASGLLLPPFPNLLRRVSFWSDYYLRWTDETLYDAYSTCDKGSAPVVDQPGPRIRPPQRPPRHSAALPTVMGEGEDEDSEDCSVTSSPTSQSSSRNFSDPNGSGRNFSDSNASGRNFSDPNGPPAVDGGHPQSPMKLCGTPQSRCPSPPSFRALEPSPNPPRRPSTRSTRDRARAATDVGMFGGGAPLVPPLPDLEFRPRMLTMVGGAEGCPDHDLELHNCHSDEVERDIRAVTWHNTQLQDLVVRQRAFIEQLLQEKQELETSAAQRVAAPAASPAPQNPLGAAFASFRRRPPFS